MFTSYTTEIPIPALNHYQLIIHAEGGGGGGGGGRDDANLFGGVSGHLYAVFSCI